jgi:hypothetical protein
MINYCHSELLEVVMGMRPASSLCDVVCCHVLTWSACFCVLSLAAAAANQQGFIILYGQVQSWTPQLVLQPLKQSPANK